MPKNRGIADAQKGKGKIKGDSTKTSGKIGAKGRRGSDNDL